MLYLYVLVVTYHNTPHYRVVEREVATLSDMMRDEMVKTSSSEALQQNRQFLATLTVPQV